MQPRFQDDVCGFVSECERDSLFEVRESGLGESQYYMRGDESRGCIRSVFSEVSARLVVEYMTARCVCQTLRGRNVYRYDVPGAKQQQLRCDSTCARIDSGTSTRLGTLVRTFMCDLIRALIVVSMTCRGKPQSL